MEERLLINGCVYFYHKILEAIIQKKIYDVKKYNQKNIYYEKKKLIYILITVFFFSK